MENSSLTQTSEFMVNFFFVYRVVVKGIEWTLLMKTFPNWPENVKHLV